MRVCAICAHPDDAEIFCGGTLAKYAKRGDKVTIIDCCDGSKGYGPGQECPKDLVEVRQKEALSSAELIGAERVFLEFPDSILQITSEQKLKLTDAIRQTGPDVIFTHYPEDQNPDHWNIASLAYECSFLAAVPGVKTAHSPMPIFTPTIYFDTYTGMNFQPTVYVDITNTIKIKKEMFLKHKSQMDFLAADKGETKGINYTEYIETAARYRGYQASVGYAEGFKPLICHLGVRTYSLLP